MTRKTGKIVVVGGGTAGWITASVVAAAHPAVSVTLIESPDIPTIGVGEGTWPSMRMTLQRIGVSEADLLKRCDASFKQGTQFFRWATGADNDRYYHPFSLPTEYASLNLAEHWLDDSCGRSFAAFVTPQAAVIDAGLAPKQTNTPPYAFNVNYGYHFDAGKFALLLHEHAVEKLGVNFVSANVASILADDHEYISAVKLANGECVESDLFIDCTGQRAMLIGDHYGVGFDSVSDVLFNDTAIAVQVPYGETDAINSTTHSTAMRAGWIWDIGLQTRRGLGYVFSSSHVDEDQALAELKDYVTATSPDADLEALNFRTIRFTPGFRETFWVKNCVAVGLSAGFVEPLEASALALIEQSANAISQQLPANREIMSVVARRFNEKMTYHWSKIIEFLKLHYALTQRDDTPYWQACRALDSWPETLKDKLLLWQQQAPWHDDAPRVDELFPSASYQYVLYGMGFRPSCSMNDARYRQSVRPQVDQVLNQNRNRAQELVTHLTPNRELLNSIVG